MFECSVSHQTWRKLRDTGGEARCSIFLNITQLLRQDQLPARRGMHVPVGCVKALVEGCLAVQQAGCCLPACPADRDC
jgi:hypothetical protein